MVFPLAPPVVFPFVCVGSVCACLWALLVRNCGLCWCVFVGSVCACGLPLCVWPPFVLGLVRMSGAGCEKDKLCGIEIVYKNPVPQNFFVGGN